jgi:radical SAM superfamily enzyme YgiQ (UPF0313 family)
MTEAYLEQGPIRPPSEACSLLLRVTRNCPWNRCEFCHTYQGQRFSLRTVDEVGKDIDTIREVVSAVVSLSRSQGSGGEVTASLTNYILQHPNQFPEAYRTVVLWLYTGGKNVFLQDANNLVHKTKDLVEILEYLKKTFPSVERITSYARGKTVSGKSVEELQELRRAGLSRIHIGLETGYDALLRYIQKGVTAREQIDAGKKVKEAGISLSEYVVLGLGGKAMWREHAIETAEVLNQIDPDFIRVRSLKVLKSMALYRKIEEGEFLLQSDDEIVAEERLLIDSLTGISSTFASDHILNLLEEVEGEFPEAKEKMLAVIDRYLALPKAEKDHFRLGRRTGLYRFLNDLSNPEIRMQVDEVLARMEIESQETLEKIISQLMESFI